MDPVWAGPGECAVCVPGQCPGHDCPGNRGTWELCKFGTRVSTCYHNPRCEHIRAGDRLSPFGRWVPGENTAAARLACRDSGGAPYLLPQEGVTYENALAIARSAHPSRVLANTGMYRYGRFKEVPGTGHYHDPAGTYDFCDDPVCPHSTGPVVTVTMMGNQIAEFHPGQVRLWSCGRITQTTVEALSNLVTGGYFFAWQGVIHFRRFGPPGAHPRQARPAGEGNGYPYIRTT